MERREFLKRSGLALAGGAASGLGSPVTRPVAIEAAKDPIVQSAPVQWALAEFAKSVTVAADAPFRISIGQHVPAAPESFAITPSSGGLGVTAGDTRGMVYALLELAARAGQEGFGIHAPITESPANPVRSV